MGEVIDLDALVPAKEYMRINGNEIELHPPKLKAYFQLSIYGSKLLNTSILTEDDIEVTSRELESAVRDTIPELSGIELNGDQVMAIANALVSLGSNNNTKETSKRGLDTKDPKVLKHE